MFIIRFIANIIWFIFGGLITALLWLLLGLVLCITIVGIPFGLQCFKVARLSLFPFGKSVDLNFSSHPISNTVWFILAGWWIALIYLVAAILNFITIINFSKGLYYIKLMKLALFPFGAQILTPSKKRKIKQAQKG